LNKRVTKKSFFSVKKEIFKLGDVVDFFVYVKVQNKREKLFEPGHTLTSSDISAMAEHEKIFIDSSGVQNYKKLYKNKKELSSQTPKPKKTTYFSINKKAFSVGDTLEFSLYLNSDAKKVIYSQKGHLYTKKDKLALSNEEKVFIDDSGVDHYKKFIKAKKESKQEAKKEKSLSYTLVNQRYFQIDDLLDFELFRESEGVKSRFSRLGHIVSKDNIKTFKETGEIYILSDDIQKYQAFVNLKRQAAELEKRAWDIHYIMSELKRVLDDIFTKNAHIKNIQMLYPLVKNMAEIIIEKKMTLNDLREFISRDYTTATHSVNVAIYAAVIALELDLSDAEVKDLILSALLHDIGKTEIADEILYKESKLNDYEFKEVRKHATIGVLIAKEYGITDKEILSGIHHHHERLDGSGYPNGLKNHYISLFARVVGICDIFDAMSTNRGFQDMKKAFEVLVDMKKNMNGKLDNDIMGSFIKIVTS
jgi:putative nucleotidyltransferase with HDIG domain